MTQAIQQSSNPDVCVIVRAYNEARVLAGVLRDVRFEFDDVIVVDDGSSDGSEDVARASGATVIRHPRNLGGGAALATGFAYARKHRTAAYFVTFDADGQHRVADAVRLVERARTSCADIILGSRFLGEDAHDIPGARRRVLRAGVFFTRLISGIAVTDTHNGLRVFNRRALESIQLRLHGMAYASELLDQVSRLGLTYEECPVEIRYTEYSISKGQSNVNAVNIAFDMLANKVRTAR